jgi:anhydro-N-acetylmuramic acid kinase
MGQMSGYLSKPAPKSLDPSDFYLIDELDDLNFNDACATLEAFTALSIVSSLKDLPKKWVLAGGGWNNPVIVKYLKEYLAERLGSFEMLLAKEVGIDGTYLEAEIFAYLAARSYFKLPISFPMVTGCRAPSLGGNLYLPEKRQ